jgi:hypothetical protein
MRKVSSVSVFSGRLFLPVNGPSGTWFAVTNPLGGPQDIQNLVEKLGEQSDSEALTNDKLSTGVSLISRT